MTLDEYIDHEPDCYDYDDERAEAEREYLNVLSTAYEELDNTCGVLQRLIDDHPSKKVSTAIHYLELAMGYIERDL